MSEETDTLPECKSAVLIATYQARAEAFLKEIVMFKEACAVQGKNIYLDRLEKEVRNDVRGLERAAEFGRDLSLEEMYKVQHMNMPKYEAVWRHAKLRQGVIALRERISTNPRLSPPQARKGGTKSTILVDIVANEGLEWIQVCTISEKRMLFDLAKQGWRGCESDSSSISDLENVKNSTEDFSNSRCEDEKHDIIRHAKNLVAASKARRIRYRHPQVKFVLTRIQEGRVAEIDSVLVDLKATGAIVEYASDMDSLI